MNEIPTVNHSEIDIQTTYKPRALNESIPLISDNIPQSTKTGHYFLATMLVCYVVINGFLHYDITRQVRNLNITVNTIQSEQMSRVDKVYNKTKDRIYRQDFKDWLVLFDSLNPKINVPKIPDKSIYEL